jgi:signal transduction histidine kinase/CheY-like chemotaxis protein
MMPRETSCSIQFSVLQSAPETVSDDSRQQRKELAQQLNDPMEPWPENEDAPHANDKFLVRLGDELLPLEDPRQMQAVAGRTLGDHLQVDRVVCFKAKGADFAVETVYSRSPAFSSPGRWPLSAFDKRMLDLYRSGRVAVSPDVAGDPALSEEEKAIHASLRIGAYVGVPLIQNGRLVGGVIVHMCSPRRWTEDEILLIEKAAERAWAAVGKSRAEKALRESESRFRALLTASSDVLYQMSADWSEMHYLQGEEFIPSTLRPSRTWIEKYIPAEDQDEVREAARQAIAYKRTFELEHRVIRADGSLGWTFSRAVPIIGEDGEISEWFGAASDVTERRQAEQKLLEADRRKDVFLATLAHELRNPLAPLLTGLELLGMGEADPEILEGARKVMVRQLAQMVHLIDDLMDVSRINIGKIALRRERVALGEIVLRAVESSRPLLEDRNHQLELDIPSKPIEVEVDSTRLTQVFSNLISNACKYTERRGRIRITVSANSVHAVVTIADNGVGIPHEMLSKVFEMFAQVDLSLERTQGGLGIGLSLVRQLVEMHGGRVQAHSDGPGQGSEFTVTLPMSSSSHHSGAQDAETPSPRSLPKWRILIADDNVDAASSLALLLGLMGHEVRTAADGQQAVEISETFRPEVAFLDIGMPRLNGLEACRQIRSEPWASNTVVVALTGWGQEGDIRRTREAGFDHHLVKPVAPNVIADVLAGLHRD